ncbi:MAG: S-layer homology domain-containing protein [Candidatus Marinamargulisbacteria bacterium]
MKSLMIIFAVAILFNSQLLSAIADVPVLKITRVEKVSALKKQISGTASKPFVVNWKEIIPDANQQFRFVLPLDQSNVTFHFNNQSIQKELLIPSNLATPPSTAITHLESRMAKKTIRANASSPKKLPVASSLSVKSITPLVVATPPVQSITPVVVATPEISDYTDLKNHWVRDIANELKHAQKLENTSKFFPNTAITRAAFSKYAVNIKGLSLNSRNLKSFSDVSKSDPYYTYIQTMASQNLIKGISKDRFGPNGFVTRLQALVVIARLLPEPPTSVSSLSLPFTDISGYKWAQDSIRKVYYYKIVSPSSRLNPKRRVSKAELVTLLYKAANI